MDMTAEEIATIRIELIDTDPPIWREVEVATSISLKTLHAVIQAAFGWRNYHLWEFSLGKHRYGPPSDADWREEPLVDAGKVRLADLLGPRKTKIDYLYDFGDSWEHRLTVSDVRAGDPDCSYPRYVAGERNGPPEDCGGIPGFYDKLETAADPRPSRPCGDQEVARRLRRGHDRRSAHQACARTHRQSQRKGRSQEKETGLTRRV